MFVTVSVKMRSAFLMLNLLIVIFSVLSVQVSAEELVKLPMPKWAKMSEYNVKALTSDKDNILGREYVLGDSIVSYLGETPVTLERLAIKVPNQSAARFLSRTMIRYAPAYQSYAVHTVTIWRDGKAIDVLDKVKSTFTNQLTEITEAAHEGFSIVNIFIPNLRRGDVLEFAFSIRGQNTAFGDSAFGSLIEVPTGRPSYDLRRTLAFPEMKEIFFDYDDDMPEAEYLIENGVAKYSWIKSRRTDDEIQIEASNFKNLPHVRYSEIGKWQDIVSWAERLFPIDSPVPSGISKLAKKLTKKLNSDEDKVRALYGYMKKNINYVGMEIGRHGYIPKSPDQVFEKGFGDCKDQTMMLISMLKSQGIEAWPALVHNSNGHEIEGDFISPLLFNHLIVYTEIDGKLYWLDPTLNQYANTPVWLVPPDYEKALLVRAGETSLTQISQDGIVNSSTSTHDFEFTKGLNNEGIYKGTVVLKGQSAESVRAKWDELGLDEFREKLTSDAKVRDEEVEALTPQLLNESDKENSLTLNEEYKYSSLGINKTESDYAFYDFRPTTIRKGLLKWKFMKGIGDKKLKHPFKADETATFMLDDGVDVEEFDIKIESPYHRFIHKGGYKDDIYVLEYNYETLERIIPEEAQEKYLEEVDEIEDYLSTRIYQFNEDPEVTLTDRSAPYSGLYKGTDRNKEFNKKIRQYLDDRRPNHSDFRSVFAEVLSWEYVPKDSKLFIHFLLAQALYENGEYEQAFEKLQYVEENAKVENTAFGILKAQVYRELGMISDLKKTIEETLSALEKGSGTNRKRQSLLGMLLLAQLDEKNYTEAANTAREYLGLDEHFRIFSFKHSFDLNNASSEIVEEFLRVGINVGPITDYAINTPFYFPAPDYPKETMEEGIEGSLVVALDISYTTKVTACAVLDKDADLRLAEAACEAAKKIRFIEAYDPTSEKGVRFKYDFSLERGVSVAPLGKIGARIKQKVQEIDTTEEVFVTRNKLKDIKLLPPSKKPQVKN